MKPLLLIILAIFALTSAREIRLPYKPHKPPKPVASPTPTPSPAPSATPTPAPRTFSVYTWNLAHGQGTDNVFDFAAQAQAVADGDIIAAQEVTPGDTPNWNAAFNALGFVNLGYASNGPTNDGQTIWIRASKFQSLGTFSKKLSDGFISWDGSTNVDKSAFAARVVIDGVSIGVINLHACWSKCADSQDVIETTGASWQRVAQLHAALDWADTIFAPDEPVILLGDFNLTRGFINPTDGGLQIDLLTARYWDLWSEAVAGNVASTPWPDLDGDGMADMTVTEPRTADRREIDFVWLRRGSSVLRLVSMLLPDSRRPCSQPLVFDGGNYKACPDVAVDKRKDVPDDFGPRRSDHNRLKATFAY